jgi:putative hydrolase of the HAD superfamily
MNNAGIKILFLDVGGVLLSNGWGKASRQKAAKQFSFDIDQIEGLHSYHFNLYEMGKLTLDEYLEIVVFNQPRNFTKEEMKAFIFSQSTQLPDILPWIKKWKKDNSEIKIFSINNEGKELNDYRIEKFGLTDCFDAFISSCDVGMCKPDRGIYQLALAVTHRPAASCIYFDDTLVHVETAGRMGIQAFQHQSFEETKRILQTFNFMG